MKAFSEQRVEFAAAKAPWVLPVLLGACFTLAARVDPWFQEWAGHRARSGNLLDVVLGDGRRMFANHFFVKADVYFHSGFYPSIYDNREAFQTPHLAEDASAVAGNNQGDEHDFLGKPRDWIDKFNRHFYPAVHTHLNEGGAHTHAHGKAEVELKGSQDVREILPWLRLSAELDPQNVRAYMVTAYWLRTGLGKADEAERFLREGLRANPGSAEILFELGRIYDEHRHDPAHARNLWELGLKRWSEQNSDKPDPDTFVRQQLLGHLARLEEAQGNLPSALAHLEALRAISPQPSGVQKQIDDLKQKPPAPTAPITPRK